MRCSTRRLRVRHHEYDLDLVERAPLPPHERSWRHPSELAADARRDLVAERASTTARTAALTGGTATILLVGIVVFALTPRGPGNPSAMSSSPVERIAIASLSVPLGSAPTATTTPALAPSAIPESTTATVTDVVPSTTVHPLSIQSTLVSMPTPQQRPLVTELGTEGYAVLASRTVVELTDPTAPEPDSLVVARHGGSIAVASVIDAGDGEGLAVLHLGDAAGEPTGAGYEVAAQPPDDDSMVTVMSDEPISVEMSGLPSVELTGASDGVAVVDAHGHLVGLYVDDPDDDSDGWFIPVDATLGDAIAPPD